MLAKSDGLSEAIRAIAMLWKTKTRSTTGKHIEEMAK